MSLFKEFKKNIRHIVAKDLGIKNINATPCLEKIVINVGAGEASKDKEMTSEIINKLEKITGQKPQITKARQAVSGFKIRKGLEVGLSLTLRGKKMYDFFERLVDVTFPRIRDFKGVKPENFDDMANLNIGIKEVVIFPEINFDDIKKSFGLNITIVTSTTDKKKAQTLLENLGMMFAGR